MTMKKIYETPNVVITTFETIDSTNALKFARSIGGPSNANAKKVTTTTLG